jgi:transcription initiation factor TFIID subunit TAF12
LEELIKRAQTEAVFRDVNERIAESAERFESETTEFVCECADPSCADRVEATLEQYESVRDEPTTFLLVPGHEDTQIERVVEKHRRFNIVEKFDRVVARTVRRLDPRAEPA